MEEEVGGYLLRRHLMTGQTSQVWEVVETASGRHFAMKILLPEMAKVAAHRNFLFHEAEVGKQLKHPHVIKIIKINRSQSTPHFVMEFFASGSLKLRVFRKEEEFFREHLVEILKKAATALAFINSNGWVHRDIKPDNILVSSAGDVRIIDFALAQRIPKGFFAKLFFRKRKAQGTRSYMSPEQIRGLALDTRADIYSFGATCYELVTGRPPFRGNTSQDLLVKHITEKPQTPSAHNPAIRDEFCDLVLHMLAKKKEDRPKDFHQVLMTLRGMKIYKD